MVELTSGWTIIVPSHDGADTLRDCLDALLKLEKPVGPLHYVLVDNDSSDHTPVIMQEFAAQRPDCLFLSEPRRGKSFALNRALDEAESEFILFLDDDIIAAGDLVCQYAAAFARNPDIGMIAGSVKPRWTDTPADWHLKLASDGRGFGSTPINLAEGEIAFDAAKGGNFALRRSALGPSRFSTGAVNFGSSSQAIGGEDTEFFSDLAGRGVKLGFAPGAIGLHVISADEMRWGSVWRRYVRIGRGAGVRSPMSILQLVRCIVRAVWSAMRLVVSAILSDREGMANNLTYCAMAIGKLEANFRRL